ncbi:hypothetical protein TTRE_0000079301 [Trichuris trichiura]|uniref:Uncharacterized protein n=1 Tax=Trichuris trichiura TaxID=36087 RepID=A0A077YXN0_TRITR|nr:hypothetical protein TTRE_0000079301 [Trichuris trichiura]
MDEEGGGHRYEVLSPTKHSKGKRTDRRTVMLTVAVAATVTSVIVIIATVLVSTLSSSELDTSYLTAEANVKIKALVNASENCNKLNNASMCFYASTMLSENCDHLVCRSYTWRFKISQTQFTVKYEQGKDHKLKAPDGLPCGENKFCYKQQCLEAEEKFNVKQLVESRSVGGWELLDGDKTLCITMDMKSKDKEILDNIRKEATECTHPSTHSLKLDFYSCTNPIPYGVDTPCKEVRLVKGLRYWEYPFMFSKEKNCGAIKKLRQEIQNKCTVGDCNYKCGRKNPHLNTSLLACESSKTGRLFGFCYENLCVPEKGFIS